MKEKKYFLNTMLAAVLGLALLTEVILRSLAPAVIIFKFNIPTMVAFSLAALLLDHYLAPGAKRCYICIPVFAVLSFGLLPLTAGTAGLSEALKLAVVGGITFTVVTWLFCSMQERLLSGSGNKLSPVFFALGLYLACQCFTGIFI